MKWLNFTITKLTFSIIFGILIGYYSSISWTTSCFIFGVLFVVLCIFFWMARKQFLQTIGFGLMALLTTVSLGIVIENFHEEKNHETHFSKISAVETVQLRIREVLKSNRYYDRYVGEMLKANEKLASGKVLLHIQKDSLSKPLHVDAVLHTTLLPKAIKPALNPTNFDYKTYLNDRYIYHQLYVKPSEFIVAKTHPKTVYGYADAIRTRIHKNLVKSGFEADELAVVEALLLGQRQQISKELQANYANAGAIHILAISGLHIGILVLLLQFLLNPMNRFRKGKFVKLLLMVCMLWSFAVLSGLSASVVRAVTMFTAIVVASHFNRQTNTLQVLTVSMFFLLLCKPHFLFDVGFQLSYAAVFAIVWLQPLWKQLWNPKSFVPKSFWSLLTVSFSAQLGVLPLSLYYFHQFPGLFFIANLTIIPVLGIILILGISVIVLAYFQMLPEFLSLIYIFVIQQMNAFVSWIASYKQFVFDDLFISFSQMIGCYLVIIAFAQYFHLPKGKNLKLALYSILVCQGLWLFDRVQQTPTEASFMVFHQTKTSILAKQHGTSLALFHELDSIAFAKNYVIQNQIGNQFIKSVSFDRLQNVYSLNDSYLLRIDSLGVYEIPALKPAYVLLTNSPKINLNRMIDSLQPTYIIADGSNYRSYVNRWKAAAEKQKIPFHYTGEKGFFSISLKE
ncbi:ComEC family competence protein [Kordia sp. YSTF-M3]|uniref:ComEC family competence protein n=1 Tax=Kordia aestuariivivens TaxID=2759037 RepID=A0ABR7QA26_9FLAO|nr:ComEC/Rec2 family competence protein [Kordia aestuariivivens]MBC8755415.1 ComEC family competence protein [Kordia aestuariivivens]